MPPHISRAINATIHFTGISCHHIFHGHLVQPHISWASRLTAHFTGITCHHTFHGYLVPPHISRASRATTHFTGILCHRPNVSCLERESLKIIKVCQKVSLKVHQCYHAGVGLLTARQYYYKGIYFINPNYCLYMYAYMMYILLIYGHMATYRIV